MMMMMMMVMAWCVQCHTMHSAHLTKCSTCTLAGTATLQLKGVCSKNKLDWLYHPQVEFNLFSMCSLKWNCVATNLAEFCEFTLTRLKCFSIPLSKGWRERGLLLWIQGNSDRGLIGKCQNAKKTCISLNRSPRACGRWRRWWGRPTTALNSTLLQLTAFKPSHLLVETSGFTMTRPVAPRP